MVATNYAWDPEFDCITKESDAASGTINVRYTQEPRIYGGLVSQRRGSTTNYFHYDNVGTTRALTNQAQTTTDRKTYTAFGEQVDSSGTTINPFGFVGQLTWNTSSVLSQIFLADAIYYPGSAQLYIHGDKINFQPGQQGTHALAKRRQVSAQNVAIKPRIKIEFIKHNFDSLTCDSTAEVQWRFKIEPKAPCDGYLIQKVSYDCHRGDCQRQFKKTKGCGSPDEFRSKRDYYELWEFKENQTEEVEKREYTDHATGSISAGRCDWRSQLGTLRFFCKKDIEGGRLYFNPGYAFEIPECGTRISSEKLPAVPHFPEWSTLPQSAESATRQFWLHYNCCDGCPRKWICANAVPGKSQINKQGGPCPVPKVDVKSRAHLGQHK